jgi:hypothetical protein
LAAIAQKKDMKASGYLSRHSAEAQTVIWISLPGGFDLAVA